MKRVQLSPVDTWFFRDGRPFSAELGFQLNIGGVFPPHPPTVVGCLRAALALEQGWSGQGPWRKELNKTLGDGPEDLGKLRFDGPYLLHRGRPLFPAPRHLLQAKSAGKRILLRPGAKIPLSDLGVGVAAPELPESLDGAESEDFKSLPDDAFLTAAMLGAVLGGKPPGCAACEGLWAEEPRVGLKRDSKKHTAEEGQLYSTRHVRLKKGFALGVAVEGVDDWELPEWAPFGGEARAALIDRWDGELALAQPLDRIRSTNRFVAIALTPLDLSVDVLKPGGRIEKLNSTVVSACLDRPLRIGGWDFQKRGPLPLRNYVAPGGVLFCEGSPPDDVEARKPFALGGRTDWGFGRVALGLWPGEEHK